MNETIDETQVLDWRKGPLINAYRMAKGDITGKVTGTRMTAAWTEDKSIARQLIVEGFLEEYHLSYGYMLLELRKSSLGHLDAKLNVLTDLVGGGTVSKKNAMRIYGDIVRAFKLDSYRIIQEACEKNYPKDIKQPEEDLMSALIKDAYRKKFEELVKITDDVLSKIKREEEQLGIAND